MMLMGLFAFAACAPRDIHCGATFPCAPCAILSGATFSCAPRAILSGVYYSFYNKVSLNKSQIRSAVLIESKKGSRRANHYHKVDWHYCYIISGSIEYYYRPVNSDKEPMKILIKTGQVFYTPPMVEHAMVFPEDTVFLTLGGGTRLHEDYENDLVRVNLV